MTISGWLEQDEGVVVRREITSDPHDPEIDGVRVVCLTEVLLEPVSDEPDVVVVIGCYVDV